MNDTSLHQQLTGIKAKEGDDFFPSLVPPFLYQNLRASLGMRTYQQEAFGRAVYYINEYEKEAHAPVHLLFHMATGSGKTVVMAGLIIYLYNLGYRHFLFFVNSTTIIEKTKDNFLNPSSSKYLFNEVINIGGKEVKIKEGTNFDSGNEDDIHLVFATIQGLHTQLNNPSENSLTYEDFEDRQIVLISDEAHHINAETKKSASLTFDEKKELISWEATVRRLFQSNPKNILLEFTATVDLSLPGIAAKYNDKIIFDYSLKQFRQDGYSKEVNVLQSGLPLFDRALQAVLLSQYRYKLFQKWGLFIKPVILFKSKTIKESEAFFDSFIEDIKMLSAAHLEKLNNAESDKTIQKVFTYLTEQNISLDNFITELQSDFGREKLIVVNSRDESEKKQLAVNTLEDEDNPYRAVFAVDKLNEGWDVLNLFDIVRLYDTVDGAKSALKKTTLSEAQLIGRGARYCPFIIQEDQPLAQRKFDDTPGHELRLGEELFYHSPYNPKYIHELNNTLVQAGIKDEKQQGNATNLKEVKKKKPKDKSRKPMLSGEVFKVAFAPRSTVSQSLFDGPASISEVEKSTSYSLAALPESLLRKAMDRDPFYYFNNLKNYFPNLRSITQFIKSNDFLGGVLFELKGSSINALPIDQKWQIAASVLEQLKRRIIQ